MGVVHNFVPHVDRPSEQLDRTLNNIDRPIDSSAKTPGIGQKNFHAFNLFAPRLSRHASNNKNAAPPAMAESATLNAGKIELFQCTRTKSTTCPIRKRSITFPKAPAKMRAK